MSYDTIGIAHQYPVIDGYVQLPPNLPGNRTSIQVEDFLIANTGARYTQLGTSNLRNGFVEMPAVAPTEKFNEPA